MVRISQEYYLKLGNIYSHIPFTPEPFDVVQRKKEEMDRHKTQREIFQQNEAMAKIIVESIPKETALTMKERPNNSSSKEISYQVKVNHLEEKKVFYEIENTFKVKSSNYLGFCQRTRLMIRDKEGNTVPNTELIEKLLQTPPELPQTRQNAA